MRACFSRYCSDLPLPTVLPDSWPEPGPLAVKRSLGGKGKGEEGAARPVFTQALCVFERGISPSRTHDRSRIPLGVLACRERQLIMKTILVACFLLSFTGRAWAQRQLFSFAGEAAQDLLGWSVSAAGDVNRDGVPDFIIGAPFELSLGTKPGSARVYSGRDGRVLHSFTGDAVKDQFGVSVSGAGDVDRDGYDDLIVGAWGNDASGKTAGQAQVFSGRTGKLLYKIQGDNAGDHFGASVSDAGDVNRDGYGDFIVGAVWDDNRGSNSGSATLYSGRTGKQLYRFDGDSAGDFFGWSVSGAGDVDKDGYDDVIVGAVLDQNNGPASGSARVFSGRTGKILYTFNGDSPLDKFGISVADAGDVDRDGHADLIVGIPGDDNNGRMESGSARVFSGRTGKILYTFDGSRPGDELGLAVHGAGDVDRDGYADLIVGLPGDDSKAQNAGAVRVFSGKTGRMLFEFPGAAKNESFGQSVGRVGDVNSDGFVDVIAGTREASRRATRAGIAQVISGRQLSFSADRHSLPLSLGGAQTLRLTTTPAHAGKVFVVLGSMSGILPGSRIGSLLVPLNIDLYFMLLLGAPNTVINPSIGLLDAKGSALARFTLPKRLPASLLHSVLDHAFIVIDPSKLSFDLASNAVPLLLVK